LLVSHNPEFGQIAFFGVALKRVFADFALPGFGENGVDASVQMKPLQVFPLAFIQPEPPTVGALVHAVFDISADPEFAHDLITLRANQYRRGVFHVDAILTDRFDHLIRGMIKPLYIILHAHPAAFAGVASLAEQTLFQGSGLQFNISTFNAFHLAKYRLKKWQYTIN
jgi:hypothetical protein